MINTDDEMDNTVEPWTFSKNRKDVMIEELFGVDLFSSFQGMEHFDISPFSSEVRRPEHRFYFNCLLKDEAHQS